MDIYKKIKGITGDNFSLNKGSKTFFELTSDPSAGGGIVAPIGSIGSIGLRDNSGSGEIWRKVGSSDTQWAKMDGDDYTAILNEPTGFTNANSVDVSFSTATKKITLTGTFTAYYKGQIVTALVSGWSSDAISGSPAGSYYLYYNGSFVWSSTIWDFNVLHIAYVRYTSGGTFQCAIRECHEFMPWQSHFNQHFNIGTWRVSGGVLSGYTLNDTTAAERRPLVSACIVNDEDLQTTISAITVENDYTIHYLSGAGAASNFSTAQNDITLLTGSRPYWNEYSGGAWGQQTYNAGQYGCLWLLAIPTTSDTDSKKYRFIWMQGQSAGTLVNMQAVLITSLNFGELKTIFPEFIFIAKLIIRYTSSDWVISQVNYLNGNKVYQTFMAEI